MRVKLVSTYPPTNCGIAVYSRYYVDALKALCDVDVVPVTRPKANPVYFIRLAFAARSNADVVHIQYDCGFFGTISPGKLSLSGMYTPLFYWLTRVAGGPAIVTTVHEIQDVEKNYSGRYLYWPMRVYYSIVYRSIALFSDRVLVHTSRSIDTMGQYVLLKNVDIIPHACFIKPVFLPPDECKSRLGLRGKRVVTMFGFVSRSKGYDIAIEALRGAQADVVLYIAGSSRTPEDAAYMEALKEKVSTLGLEDRVRFHGYVNEEDTPIVMGATDVVLMPYSHIVQSGAMNFALAYLKPVLASDIGGFAEVAENYGSVGRFRPGDTADLAKKLDRMLYDEKYRDELLVKVRRYVSLLSMEKIAGQVRDVYEKAIQSRGRS